MVDWYYAAVFGRHVLVSRAYDHPAFLGYERACCSTHMICADRCFLRRYVAMHAMQEDDSSHQEIHSNGYASEGHGGHAPPKQGPTMSLTLAAVAGMLLPLLTQFGHHH